MPPGEFGPGAYGPDSRGTIALVCGIIAIVLFIPECCCGAYGGCCMVPVSMILAGVATWLGYVVKSEVTAGLLPEESEGTAGAGLVTGIVALLLNFGLIGLWVLAMAVYFVALAASQF